MDREVAEKDRDTLVNALYQEYKSFDAALLTLSAASLALSVTTYTNSTTTECKALIGIAWFFFIASITSQLYSRLCSIEAHRTEIEQHNKKDRKDNPKSKETEFFNKLSLITFVSGLVFFLFFVMLN